MKAIIQIIAVLMTIQFGAVEAIAQSARRNVHDNNRETKVSTKRSNRNINSSSTRKQSQAIQSRSSESRNNHYTRPNSAQSDNKSRSSAQMDQKNRSSNSVTANSSRGKNENNDNRIKSSTTNRHNPRSTYKAPERKSNISKKYRDPKYSNRTVTHSRKTLSDNRSHQSTNVSRRYYPAKRVQIHVHPKTYHGAYRVLYYPAHRDIVWTRSMYRDYTVLYPGYTWRYPIGYRVHTISTYDARYNVGEVSRVYGRVYATWHNRETDDLLLFFGGEFPHQNFTMVIPGSIARRYSWRPERYFLGQHVMATGLITSFEGKPEMIIKQRHQMNVY